MTIASILGSLGSNAGALTAHRFTPEDRFKKYDSRYLIRPDYFPDHLLNF